MKNITNILTMILLSLVAGFSVVACSDDDKTVVVPDNWVTVSTTPLIIDYKGGSLTCDYTLAAGLDASVPYVINREGWCSGYIKDGKFMIDVELSEDINGRTAKMFLVYDANHQVELTVEQGKAPVVLVTGIDKSAMPEFININETLDLNTVIKVLPAKASYKKLIFTLASGSESIIELSEAGVATGLNPGEATINVATTDNSGVTDVITLKVAGNIILDRTSWTVTTSITYSNGQNYVTDGGTGKPEDILDGDAKTYLSLVKPGKTYTGGYVAGGIDDPLYFVVDMGTQQSFNYFMWAHRVGNSYDYLRVWGISMYGSNDGSNFTEIQSNIDIPYGSNTDEIKISVPKSTYRYIKVQYVKWSDIAGGAKSGSTIQVAEFKLGEEF